MSLEERMANLELQLGRIKRRNRWLLAAVLLLAGGLVIPAVLETTAFPAGEQATGSAKEVRANRFILEDQKGTKRASLEATGATAALGIYDEKGNPRVSLYESQDGTCLAFSDGKGEVKLMFSEDEDGSKLNLFDELGNLNVSLDAGADSAILSLVNESKKHFNELRVDKYGSGIIFGNNIARSQAYLGMDANSPTLRLSDEHSSPRAEMTLHKYGPALQFYDEKLNLRFVAGRALTETPDGISFSYPESSLILFGPDGKVIWNAIK
jgi:hypothetical protein